MLLIIWYVVLNFIIQIEIETFFYLTFLYVLICFLYFLFVCLLQYTPFKAASKSSLFERAKALGLELAAEKILQRNCSQLKFSEFVNRNVDGVNSIEKVKDGIKNILSHIFSKDIDVLDTIQNM